jgi:ketosteroid isomerase-like protein
MNDQEARDFLSRVFQALFDPTVTAEAVGAFFAPDYVQIADGKEIDRAGFIDHVRVLKNTLRSGSVTLEKVVASGSAVATLHVAAGQKQSGESVRMKVHAFFEIEDGLIRRTEELTHMVMGHAEDRDLGSRTSA